MRGKNRLKTKEKQKQKNKVKKHSQPFSLSTNLIKQEKHKRQCTTTKSKLIC